MGIKSWVSGLLETKSENPYSDDAFRDQLGTAGVKVNYTTAMRHQDVYTCVRIKSEAIGQLPLSLYRTKDKTRTKITSGREFDIFTKKPNSYQTWQEFNEMYVTSMELRGNFYAEIKRNIHGYVYEIVPFKQQLAVSVNMDANGTVYYTYVTNDNKSGRSARTYANNQILHIKMNSQDGYNGMSPITYTAKSIGAAIAGEQHASALFENGARPSGVLTTDNALESDEAIERLRKDWNNNHGASKRAGGTAILEFGMTYQAITMSAVDSQLIEQRKFSREQISSIFRVPIHLLNAADGLKYNSIEHNNTAFFRDSLMPLVTKLENNLNPLLPKNHTIKLDEKQFVRGDRKTQVETTTLELKSGLITVNEGRVELGYEPVEGGDVSAVATNNLTFGRWEDLEKIQASLGNRGNQVAGSEPNKGNGEPPKSEENDE